MQFDNDVAITRGSTATLSGTVGQFKPATADCRVIVSACGGPIAVQNHQNELANCALDYPSGSLIRFSGNTESAIEVVTPRDTVSTAQPRLAVALDFADTVGKENDQYGRGVFESINADSLASPFIVKVNSRLKLPNVKWIAEAMMYLFNGESSKPTPLALSVSHSALNTFSLTLDSKGQKLLSKIVDKPRSNTLFIQITLDSSVQTSVFTHYDITTPWSFRLELTQPREDAYQLAAMAPDDPFLPAYMPESYFNHFPAYGLQRHGKWGEIPNHKWYSDNFVAEYDYPWNTNKRNSRDAQYPT